MNKTNIPEPDLDILLKQTLKDDLPLEVEARMSRQFLNLKRVLNRPEELAEQSILWQWARWAFRNEILALASAVMLIMGVVMHLGGHQSVWAHSIERLKVAVTISRSLGRATFMDCTVLKPGEGGKESRYRVRWRTAGITRVDMDSGSGAKQTRWISDAIAPPDPVWQPAMEFLTPTILSQNLEARYRLMQTVRKDSAGPDELLLAGQENKQVVEITVDEKTYLPTTLKKYLPDSGRIGEERRCLTEVRFLWNKPIPPELFVPKSSK